MSTILQLKTSLFSDEGQSSRLANRFVELRREREPGAELIVRDFAVDPVPHLTAEAFQGFALPESERSPAQRAAVAYSDTLIDELRRADRVVLGLPLYNFGIPSTLKAYFDHIARAGVTFRYTESGPVGLLENRPVHVFAARGGRYAGTSRDTQTPYIVDMFAHLGITDLRFVYAEGLNMGEDTQSAALASAHREIAKHAA